MKPLFANLFIFAVIVLIVFFALLQMQPPLPQSEFADSTQFSSARAMKYVRVIASEPHFVGSPAHARVKTYLLNKLRSLELEPFIQKTTVEKWMSAVVVHNIIAQVKGTSNSKAVLLAAHYDSKPLASGAGDDGYAIAAILETIRALKTQQPLKNDLIILLTDCEEVGMFGAKAFINESPLADTIGFALNFEGRGTSGPSIMFETNDENGWVIREFDKAIPSKLASSLMYDLYKLLPNNTDFTLLKQKASSGLNFSHIGSVENYHSVTDNIDHLDEGTLQDHGANMLAAVRHFGNINLDKTLAPNVVYFKFLLPEFVIYPISLNIILAIAATVLFILVLVLGFKKKQLRVLRILFGFIIILIRIVLAGGAVFLLWKWLGPFQPEFELLYLQRVYHSDLYLIGFIAFGIFVTFLFHHILVRKIGLFNIVVGALFLWFILTWITAVYVPGGNYLFVWPLLFTLIGLAYILWKNDDSILSLKSIIVLLICAIPGIFLFTQILSLIYQAMTLLIVGGLVGLIVLLFSTLQLHVTILTYRKPWFMPILCFIASIIFISVAFFQRHPSDIYPKPNTILYAFDADSGNARWITWDRKLDDWTQQFFVSPPDTIPLPQFIPFVRMSFITSRALAVSFAGPEVKVISDRTIDTIRTLKIRIRSLSNASVLIIDKNELVNISEGFVNGKRIGENSNYHPLDWPLFYSGLSSEPFELELKWARGTRLRLRFIEIIEGLPRTVIDTLKPRPSWMIPCPDQLSDAMIVGKTFIF
jgi:hypothetical protein